MAISVCVVAALCFVLVGLWCAARRRMRSKPVAQPLIEYEENVTVISLLKESREHKIGMGLTGNKVTSLQAGGRVEKWNQENPDKRICLGSVLLEVNGQRGNRQLKEEIKRAEGTVVIRAILALTEMSHSGSLLSKSLGLTN